MLRRDGWAGRLTSRRTATRRSTAPTSCSSSCASAVNRRAWSTRRCPRVRHDRPGDDRARRLRQGAAHRARGAGDRRGGGAPVGRRAPGSSISPTRSASSRGRCSTRAIGRIGLCNVAIGFQRRFAQKLRASRRSDVELEHVGLNHLRGIAAVVVEGRRSAAGDAGVGSPRIAPRWSACRSTQCARFGAVPVLLPALLLLDRRGAAPSSATATSEPRR